MVCSNIFFFWTPMLSSPQSESHSQDIQYNPQTASWECQSPMTLCTDSAVVHKVSNWKLYQGCKSCPRVTSRHMYATCVFTHVAYMFARTAGTLNAQHQQRFLWSLIPSLQKQRSFPHFPLIHPQTAVIFQGCVSNWQVRALLGAGSARSELSTLILA